VSPPPSEEGINIVLEDELVIGDRAPSSAQAETAPPALPVPEPAPVKATLRDRFPFRPGGKSS
jgi:hypothetical protein